MPNRQNRRQQAVRAEYAHLAAHYDRRWAFYLDATHRETLARLPLRERMWVLDVGCGTGILLQALLRHDPSLHLVGVALTREMLAVAKARLGVVVALAQADAAEIPFPSATFDLVVSCNVFHYLRPPRAALREVRRVLKPAGVYIVTDWCDDYLACRLRDRYLRLFNRAHFWTYRQHECHALLAEEGFTAIRVERYKVNWLWGLMTATAQNSARVPAVLTPDSADNAG